MLRSIKFGALGGMLAVGAPVGLLAVRLLEQRPLRPIRQSRRNLAEDRLAYTYLGLATAVAFTTFGFALGRLADRLEALADRDPLTGLHNARRFREQLKSDAARAGRYKQPLSLLLIDVDGLKALNDSRGHAAGDAALRHAGSCISGALRRSDFGSRWGGDEFGVIAPQTTRPQAHALAARLLDQASAHRPAGLMTTISIGVGTLGPVDAPGPGDEEALFAAADAALYDAKRAGGNTVRTHDAADHQTARAPASPRPAALNR
jgi:diguanylate cyclase (GGDEF)-like protein